MIVTIKDINSNIPQYLTNIISNSIYRNHINRINNTYNIPKNIIIGISIMLGHNYTYIKKSQLLSYFSSKLMGNSLNFQTDFENVFTETMSLMLLIENDPLIQDFKTFQFGEETFLNTEAYILMTKTLANETMIFDCLSCDLNPKCNLFNNKIIKNLDFNDKDIETMRHKNCPYSKNLEDFYVQVDNNSKSLLTKLLNKKLKKPISNMRDAIRAVVTERGNSKNATSQIIGSFQEEIKRIAKTLKNDKNALYIFLQTIGNNIVKTEFGKTYKDSEDEVARTINKNITNWDDIVKLSTKDLAETVVNEDLFIKKVINEEYEIKTNQSSTSGGIFILLDVSGSMGAGANHPTFMSSSTGSIASAFISVFGERCNNTLEPIYFRTFDDGVSDLEVIKTQKERDVFIRKMEKFSFNGGGTDIINAMEVCLSDFTKSKVDPKKSELLLISDLEGSFPKNALKIIHDMHSLGTKVRIMKITSGSYPDMEATKNLQSVSDVFIEINTSKPIQNNIFDIIKPIGTNNEQD